MIDARMFSTSFTMKYTLWMVHRVPARNSFALSRWWMYARE